MKLNLIKNNNSYSSGIVLIGKFHVNIKFSGAVRILAASPYTKWLNTDSASYGSLVAAASLNTRSICKLLCDLSCGFAQLFFRTPTRH